MSASRLGSSNAAAGSMDELARGPTSLPMDLDALSDKMDSISLISKGSRKSTSTLSSLLSNKSLELVFGLIDEYYVKSEQPSERCTANTAELLGNLAPSTGSSTAHGTGLDALLEAADGGTANPLHDLVVRAIGVADRDRKRLEELVSVLSEAQARASSAPDTPHEQLEQLDSDLAEIRSLLVELKGIEQACCMETISNASERHAALAPRLAALAQWQERVLSNALVNPAHMQAQGHRVAASRAVQAAPTATQFIQQHQPHSPYVAPAQYMSMAPALHQPGAFVAQNGHIPGTMPVGSMAAPITSMPISAPAQHIPPHRPPPPPQQQYAQYQAQPMPQQYLQAGGTMGMPTQMSSTPMQYAQTFAGTQVGGRPMASLMRRHYSLDNKIDLAPSAQAASSRRKPPG